MAALGESLGRGAMTNHWVDVRNADVVLVMGANPAENHPISFRWILEAHDRGAKVIHVDPRFSRTSARADLYAPIRPGTDVAFLGGLIRHLFETGSCHLEYLRDHTNATFLVDAGFGFDARAGVFEGLRPDGKGYARDTWRYRADESGVPLRDRTLEDPACVFQVLRRHFARYDAETVSRITGTPRDLLLEVYEAMASTGRPGRVATVMYGMGWTQSTHGTQNIFAAAIVQLLLGNIGLAGGGINALRGESNVQGSTDHGLLFHLLPGYLKAPRASQETLAAWLAAGTPRSTDPTSANWLQNYPSYAVSLLRWLYGEAGTPENEHGYGFLPKYEDGADHSWLGVFDAALDGRVKGLLVFGQNPAVSGADTSRVHEALARLDFLVTVNLWDTETSSFWRRPGVSPADVATEVVLLPCAASVEKEGSITNSGRWAQWRRKASEPPGEARPDAWILNQVWRRLRRLEQEEPGPGATSLLAIAWDHGDGEVDAERVAREVNGRALADVKDAEGRVVVPAGGAVRSFTDLRADGSTACGNWLYAGSHTDEGNRMARRDGADAHPAGIGLHAGWAWCWPMNRRILYNRASCDPKGVPYDARRFAVRWLAEEKRWEGDVPDGGWPPGAKSAFLMRPEGVACLFAPALLDGPMPEHYEPWESPVANLLHARRTSPVLRGGENAAHGDPQRFPIVATTYRLTEHWQSGAMTRNTPWLAELEPDMFVEMSAALAKERGIANGDRVIVESARGRLEAVAVVTSRVRPLEVDGRPVHVVGIPWHWGWRGIATGDSANVLTPTVRDGNAGIPETKAFLCQVRRKDAT